MFRLKKRYKLIAFLCFTAAAEVSFGYEFNITCDPSGNVKKDSFQSRQNTTVENDHVKRGLKMLTTNTTNSNCLAKDLNPTTGNPNGLVLTSEVNSRARAWSTRNQNPETIFDRNKIQDIITQAIKNNVDPYFALAISIMEAPPYLKARDRSGIADLGGEAGATVNNVALADSLGCRVSKKPKELGTLNKTTLQDLAKYKDLLTLFKKCKVEEDTKACTSWTELDTDYQKLEQQDPEKAQQITCFNGPACKGIAIPNPNPKTIDFTSDSSTNIQVSKVCLNSTVNANYATLATTVQPNLCCATIKMSSGDNAEKKLKLFAFMHLLSKLQKQEAPAGLTPPEKIAWLIQGFNGRGIINGVSKCVSGLNMSKTPMNGAIAGDLMVNTLLSNPEVRSMVERISTKQKLQQKSLFCMVLGEGLHQINSLNFPDLQKKYALSTPEGQSSQERFSDCAKGSPLITFESWSEHDRKKYFEGQ